MESLFFITLKYFCVLLGCLLAFTILGRFLLSNILSVSITGRYAQFFAFLLSGIGAFIITSSLIFTGGQTVNLGLAVVSLMLILTQYRKKKIRLSIKHENIKASYRKWKPVVLEIVIFSALLSLWQTLFLFKGGAFPFEIPYEDCVFYSRVSESLILTGQENIFPYAALFDDGLKGLHPYHFFEIWFNASISHILQLTHITSLLLVTLPLFLLLMITGYLALAEHFFKSVGYHFSIRITAILLLFLTGIFPEYLAEHEALKYCDHIAHNPLQLIGTKTAPVYVFAIAALLALLHQNTRVALLLALALPFVSFATAPGIFAGITFSIAGLFVLRKIKIRKILGFALILFIAAGSFLVIFQSLGHQVVAGVIQSQLEAIINTLNKGYIADIIYFFRSIPLQMAATYLPWIILLIFMLVKLRTSNHKALTVFGFVTFFIFYCSLLAWGCLRFIGWDSIQFFSNTSTVLVNVWISGSILFLLSRLQLANNRHYQMASLIVIVLLLFIGIKTWHGNNLLIKGKTSHQYESKFLRHVHSYKHYSDTYILTLARLNNALGNPPKAYLLEADSYPYNSSRNPYNHIPAQFLVFFPGEDVLFSLDVFNIPEQEGLSRFLRERLISPSVFYRFVKRKIADGTFVNVEQSQVDFIEQVGIKLLITRPDSEISDLLKAKIVTTVSDTNTGEKVMVLR